MPAKRSNRQVAVAAPPAQPGFLTSIYREVTSPDNTTVVRSIALFGVAVAFLHSSWSEILAPQ
ncbi:hypothetical protein DFH27DRAFT_605548 [Peziza echinospora]|nr:hypothetical protein DFH27DRAFT_605548 [Peziza echinospora]